MTGRFLPFCCVLLAACATAKDSAGGDPIDAAVGDPIDAADDPTDGPPGCVPTTEQCDGDDDDCDDVVDNGCSCSTGATQACYSGTSGTAGMGPCVQGIQTCVDGQWSATCAGEVTPVAETCDTVDNDCDGTPDDGNPGGGGNCATGLVGACAAGTNQCISGGISCVQNVQPTTELCNGVDDDCNASTADGSAESWFGQSCDGADTDICFEGGLSCNGVGQVCGDSTGNSVETNLIVDGGYEAAGAPAWTKFSTNFGSPLCTVVDCGTGTGTGPRGGTVWNWLGGTTLTEVAFTSQAITIPVGTATLTFFFEAPVCGTGGAAETFTVRIDGVDIYATNNSDARCGMVGYVAKTFSVNAFANGGSHTVEFRGTFNNVGTTATNFMVDDVRLVSCQ